MPANVDTDLSGFNHKFSSQSLDNGYLAAANDAHQAMGKYVPMLHVNSNTNLRSQSFVAQRGRKINYTVIHARPQFYGFTPRGSRIRRYTTPGTSRRWDLRLKGNTTDMNEIENAFLKGSEL